jgi:lipopolysaccharide/colanic/teichoic acid biosynthesis glycosyltransferase
MSTVYSSATTTTHRAAPRQALTRRPLAPATLTPPRPPASVRRTELAKTIVEYPLAVLLFVLSIPAILFAMLAVRLTSKGSALYTQQRVGRGGRVFTIYKIRTMYDECESLTGPRWALPGDPRITPVGLVLRALHIDELPQFVNVLKGEMALIGPRPERPEICKQLRLVIPNYDARHVVKPGLTGYAQVHLPPDSNLRSARNKVAYDRFYILRIGVWMDLYVYACTALKLLGLKRVYQRRPRKPAEDE